MRKVRAEHLYCLNPCCNGRGSKTAGEAQPKQEPKVLILVVMEEGQRLSWPLSSPRKRRRVLILVVMEEGQRPSSSLPRPRRSPVLILVVMEEGQRLYAMAVHYYDEDDVLILVVMEEGQRLSTACVTEASRRSLNPCCNGRGSKT